MSENDVDIEPEMKVAALEEILSKSVHSDDLFAMIAALESKPYDLTQKGVWTTQKAEGYYQALDDIEQYVEGKVSETDDSGGSE